MATTDNKQSRRMEGFHMLRSRGEPMKQASKPMELSKLMEMLDEVGSLVVPKATTK